MPKTLTKRQKLAYTIIEIEIQSLLDSDSELETDILYVNHLLIEKCLVPHLNNLPPAKFKQLTRTSHFSFGRLCDLIKDDPLFNNNSQNKQKPLEIQLGIGLCSQRSNGNGASLGKIQMTFGVGARTVGSYTKKIIQAILNLKDQLVMWHSEDEHKESSQVMQLEGFHKCIGFVNRTTIPLSQKPALNRNIYFDCKKSKKSLDSLMSHKQQLKEDNRENG
ncbi:hypothetical protein BY996DRAFT_6481559 [Phakopsora pachyrhizi]|uniref:Uncharacterized protein n=1 Tax=Phakopsora pachyrhizi TaxID=170000 RepID=A0AAV0AS02_PHAPC|nr:hypothetical protein BY996DRAFT_6481559 [Phakopsora pachyrhizi]CAH7671312.1 hypothetical protein PPACK8108_LOCUS6082 [Phakopsora pachyrhizi]